MSAEAEAFAALGSIESGRWDRHLQRLHGAIHLRQREDDYLDKIIVGTVPDGDVEPPVQYNSNTDRG